MATSLTLLESASSQGYRVKHVGDIVVVTMQGAAFATTARDHMQVRQWARASASIGNAHRDRTAYCDRHQILLARRRGGLVTRGPAASLAHLVQAMRDSGISLDEWAIPEHLQSGIAKDP